MKLQAPKGTKRVSFAGVQYEVAADGTVDVPDEALEPLLAHGLRDASLDAALSLRQAPRHAACADRPIQKDPPAPEDASAPRPAGHAAPGRATR